MVFHVLNRGVGRRTLFAKDQDYRAFEKVLQETLRIRSMRVCAYCLMPNHWHFILWPEQDVVRYVERNAQRAGLVARAESWRWSSLGRAEREESAPILSTWPVPRPVDWLQMVGQPQSEAELRAVRHCVDRGCPFGGPDWVVTTARRLGLESTLRQRGRPRQQV